MITMFIPQCIHQIWSEKYDPLPESLRTLGETWKNNHPKWKYIYWNEKAILAFINEYYPAYMNRYHAFPYDIQRWDAIRYLILLHFGGLYIDFDYECLMEVDPLIDTANCCFAMEPVEHLLEDSPSPYFNNALIGCTPGHPFIREIVDYVFEKDCCLSGNKEDKSIYILESTGPMMLSKLYQTSNHKNKITLLPARNVSPFSFFESRAYLNGEESKALDDKLEEAYAVHYFLNSWN